jgi:hypothetical protein
MTIVRLRLLVEKLLADHLKKKGYHFGRGKAAGPGLRTRLVDSLEKAARRAECVSEMAAIFD